MVSKAVLFATHPVQADVALLQVGNKPLVQHALEDLIEAGVRDVAVITSPGLADDVSEVVDDAVGDGMSAIPIVREGPVFADALRQAAPFIGGEPFLVHLGDNLSLDGLATALPDSSVRENDVVALVEPNRRDVTPVGAGLASLRAAGVYVFGPGALNVDGELDAPDDWDLQIACTADRLAAAGGRLELQPVNDWWRYRERPDALLQANRFFLSGIRPSGPADAWLENTDLQGPVIVHSSARIGSSTIRGPVVIGAGAEIRDAYIGPYTSIGPNVVIENAEVENSIILQGASIKNLGGRLEASVVGAEARVFRDFRLPRALRLNVGNRAEVAVT